MAWLKKILCPIMLLYSKICRFIDPVAYARKSGVKIGKNCRLYSVDFGTEPYMVTLGDHVSATNTRFITHDGGVWVFREKEPEMDIFAPTKVGNNVFFGMEVLVMPGVTIGNNVVIGAGAIVTKDIPSNCVAVGIPAKPVKSLDEYYEKVKKNCLLTKSMSIKQKENYLRTHFKI
jgi:acetyltransferase-like isoleucine patch superfamily enzyme